MPATASADRSIAGDPVAWPQAMRLASFVASRSGWQRVALAMLLGASAVLALPPLYILPALIPAFAGLVWLLDGARSVRGAFATGFCFGLGYFTAGLYWVANALLTKPEEFGLVAPLAPLALASILAPHPAAACAMTRLAPAPGLARVIILAAAWTVFEWVRSWAFTGFPWNLLGSVWAFSDAMLQTTSALGTYGLGLVTVAAAAMPALLALPAGRHRPVRLICASWGVLLLLLAAGSWRLAALGDVGIVDGPLLRLVQGNIPQSLKWRRDLVDAHVLSQAKLGATPAARPPTHVFWSEAAVPLFLNRDPERLAVIAAFTPPGGLSVLGTLRTTPPGQPFQVWNSMLAVDATGRVVDWYDKAHLVPFGEFMPLRSVLGLGSVAGGSTDFSRGPGVRTIVLPGLPPVGPLICYEIIFPGAVVDPDARPEWLLNLTNDGWYGQSAGPYQHLVAARLRAVEEGLPVVRVANTGISAIIDPLGRVTAALGLGKTGVVDGALPQPLVRPTPFARTGPLPIVVLALSVIAGATLVARRK